MWDFLASQTFCKDSFKGQKNKITLYTFPYRLHSGPVHVGCFDTWSSQSVMTALRDIVSVVTIRYDIVTIII